MTQGLTDTAPLYRLTLTAIDGPGVESAGRLLARMAGPLLDVDSGDLLPTPQDAVKSLANQSEGHLIVLYPAPEQVIANAMQKGQTPEGAVETWRLEIEHALSFCRGNRKNTTLINAQQALASPERLRQLLNERLGASQPLVAVSAIAKNDLDRNSLFELLASYCLGNLKELRPLVNELNENTLPLQTIEPEQLIEAAWNQLDSGPEEKGKLSALQKENELVLRQLFLVQAELETYYLENKKLEQDKRSLNKKLRGLYSSRSWKITKPIRSFSKLLGLARKSRSRRTEK